jgi:iron complex transport system substrate-binding protein
LSTLALVAATTLAAGCAAEPTASPESAPETTESAVASAFPVTIEHAFGATTIESEPQRVVAWGWGAADAVIALGVTPVGIPFQPYGGDENGLLPWIAEELEAQGAEVPAILAETDGIPPYEAIAALEPDLILAPYSGIDQEQYDTLAAIAPVVAYPEIPWSTPWRDVISITGTALGKSDEAAAVLAGIEESVAAAATANPEFDGVSIAEVWDVAGTFYIYRPADPRVEFATDLGFTNAESVEALAPADAPTFYYTLATERVGELESDLLLIYGTTQEEIDAFLATDYAQLMPQVTEGRYATLVGAEVIASVSPPTALSLTWGIDTFVEALRAGLGE